MNQILYSNNKSNKKKSILFKLQFLVSLIAILLFTIYFIAIINERNKKEKLSKNLTKNFGLNSLYSSNSRVVTLSSQSLIIGVIKIEKLGIEYPIFSYCSTELLKSGTCRFYGPNPNSSGNLCIAGHNYNDNNFFGRLFELNIGDSIEICDSSGIFYTYYIYDKYEIDNSDTSCTSQETNGKSYLTLITCTNFNNKRLVIKAKK